MRLAADGGVRKMEKRDGDPQVVFPAGGNPRQEMEPRALEPISTCYSVNLYLKKK